MGAEGANKDGVLGTSLVLSIVGLVLLIGVTWYFQYSKQQQVEYDRKLLLQLQDQLTVLVKVHIKIHSHMFVCIYIATYIHKNNRRMLSISLMHYLL